MASRSGKLTALQAEALEAFARRAPEFFLTGGAVLVGWTLKHRTTDDLDLFTTSDDAMASADAAVRGAASEVHAAVTPISTTPDFHRYLLARGDDSLRIDLVRDRTPPLHPKVRVDGITMDSPEEIVANKIAAVVGRSEVRDLREEEGRRSVSRDARVGPLEHSRPHGRRRRRSRRARSIHSRLGEPHARAQRAERVDTCRRAW